MSPKLGVVNPSNASLNTLSAKTSTSATPSVYVIVLYSCSSGVPLLFLSSFHVAVYVAFPFTVLSTAGFHPSNT